MTRSVPRISSTTRFSAHATFGFRCARSCMILEARSASRRWTIVTLLANFVRKVASSIAESPPPTTTRSCPLKKKPSQVGAGRQAPSQQPRARTRGPGGGPRRRWPTMMARACQVRSAVLTVEGPAREVDPDHVVVDELGAEPLGLAGA